MAFTWISFSNFRKNPKVNHLRPVGRTFNDHQHRSLPGQPVLLATRLDQGCWNFAPRVDDRNRSNVRVWQAQKLADDLKSSGFSGKPKLFTTSSCKSDPLEGQRNWSKGSSNKWSDIPVTNKMSRNGGMARRAAKKHSSGTEKLNKNLLELIGVLLA